MSVHSFDEKMTPQARFEAIAELLATAFFRLEPTHLARIRGAVEVSGNRSKSSSYLLDKEGGKSVYASVNQE